MTAMRSTSLVPEQPQLFPNAPVLPPGMMYQRAFLTTAEEQHLLECFSALPFREAQYKEWNAKRRIVSYGGRYDFSRGELLQADPIASFLLPLRDRIAAWSGIPAGSFTHALIAEYRPGTQLGWHRDVPDFESIVGVSLSGAGRMRLRPYPPPTGRCANTRSLDLEARSAYLLSGPGRWLWQHAISPTKTLRYSITFRTLAQ
jgi:alkylated DNA repair dioxygenase AlkB